ncbi:hypothetical protein ACNKHO_04030 [Shigella flexneri]
MVCWTAAFGFGGEESAGAFSLRFDGTPSCTDKDGIIMCLLAAEITAVTGKNPQEHYNELAELLARQLQPSAGSATSAQKRRCQNSLRKWSAPAPWRVTLSPRV